MPKFLSCFLFIDLSKEICYSRAQFMHKDTQTKQYTGLPSVSKSTMCSDGRIYFFLAVGLRGCAPRFSFRTYTILHPYQYQMLSIIFMLMTPLFTVRRLHFKYLQSPFDPVQSCLHELKLVLNTDKTKLMLFSHTKQATSTFPIYLKSQRKINWTSLSLKALLIDHELLFKTHIAHLINPKLDFYFRN